MKLRRIDHVGIIVEDLPAAKAFFLDLGLEVQGEGEWLDQIVGLTDVKTAFVFLGMPDGQINLELIKYYRPSDERGIQQPLANTPGIQHIVIAVEDIEAIVAKLKRKGWNSSARYKTMKQAISYASVAGLRGLFSSWTSRSNKLNQITRNLTNFPLFWIGTPAICLILIF